MFISLYLLYEFLIQLERFFTPEYRFIKAIITLFPYLSFLKIQRVKLS